MRIQHLAIVAHGTLSKFQIEKIRKCDSVIGVDRASYVLIKNGIVPNLAIGDFDSTTKKEMTVIRKTVSKTKEYPSEKNKTDLELAVSEAIALKAERVQIFGVTGKRFDHAITAVFLLERFFSFGIHAEIIDDHNVITLIQNNMELVSDPQYPYVSVLPLHNDAIVTLEGFRYPLKSERMIWGSSRGVSNEIAAKTAAIHVHEGLVLVIHSRDGK